MYLLTRAENDRIFSMLAGELSGEDRNKDYSRHEVQSLRSLVAHLIPELRLRSESGPGWLSNLDGFFFSYIIEHIGKEFDLLKISSDGECVLNIELKSPRTNETSIVRDTIAMVKEYGLFDKMLMSSFDPKLLLEAKRIDPKTKTGFLYSPNSKFQFRIYRNPLEEAKSIGAEALHPFSMYVNADLVKKAHDCGMTINVWTVNSPRSILRLAQLGVDGIITDYPDVVKGVLEAHDYR